MKNLIHYLLHYWLNTAHSVLFHHQHQRDMVVRGIAVVFLIGGCVCQFNANSDTHVYHNHNSQKISPQLAKEFRNASFFCNFIINKGVTLANVTPLLMLTYKYEFFNMQGFYHAMAIFHDASMKSPEICIPTICWP